MKKRAKELRGFVLGVLLCAFVMGMAIPALAANYNQNINVIYRDIKLKINGNTITPKDANGSVVEPFIYNGTTYLPVRAVGDAVGYTVNWDQNTSTVDLIGRGSLGNTPTSNTDNTPNNTTTVVNMIDVHTPYDYSKMHPATMVWYPSSGGSSLTMGGTSYKNAMFIAPAGEVGYASFNLAGKYTNLNGIMGVVDGTTSSGSTYNLTVNFYGDGNLIKTVEVPPTGLPKDFSVNIDGVNDFRIEVVTAHRSHTGNFQIGFAELKLQ